ncbi:MAG: hypothetical protein PVH88_11665 [Ignavibacteria bacterium]|jgi:hypothetical protein
MEKTKKKNKTIRTSEMKNTSKQIIERLEKLRDEISEAWDNVTVEEELNEQRKRK